MTQLLNALPGALAQGLIWGVMAIGVYITYKVLDIADLTVDGSICTGAAVCTMLLLGGQSPWLALDHLSLTLRDGDFVTVIGGNGAGKSTMQNAICGTWQPDEGSIELDGVNVSSLPEYKRARYLGRVYQDPMMGTSAGMEIEENLALAERRGRHHTLRPGIRRGEREDYRRRLRELGLGLEDRLTTKVGTLSGGQRQALTLLMATLQKPKLLLLDEHTAALDYLSLTLRDGDFVTVIGGNGAGKSTMQNAICGTRLLMLHNGRIVLDISGEEKARLTVPDLLALFSKVSGQEYDNDRALLA